MLPSLNGVTNQGVKPAENWIVARDTYTKKLKSELIPLIYDTLLSIYGDARDLSLEKSVYDVEQKFLELLSEVKVWPINIVKGETHAIIEKCPWFAELLKGVFVSNVMVLSSAQLNLPNAPAAKLRIQIPQCPEFVQALYTNVAARFFDRPSVFRSEGLTSDQIYQNIKALKEDISNAIDETIVQLIPLRNIIQTSINFQGNHAVIATKPPQRPQPQAVRRSHRGYEDKQQNVQQERQNFQERKRLTPPVPPMVAAQVAEMDQAVLDKKPSVSRISFKPETKKEDNKTRPSTKVTPVKLEKTEQKIETDNNKGSRISFRPSSKPAVEKKVSEEKKPPFVEKKGHSETKKHQKVESMSQRTDNVHIRPSQFKQRTGSDAIKQVLGKLNMGSIESRSSNSSSSSSTSSSPTNSESSGRFRSDDDSDDY